MYYLFSIFIFQEFGPVDKLRSGTRRLFTTLCTGTAPTTEHVYVPNHARGLVDYSLCCARRLCRPPSTFTFPTTLGDLSTGPYAVLGDCAAHRALYARGLVDQLTNLRAWGLHRPPSTIRSGTGRPAHQFENSGTVPTTERYMLGDWSISLFNCRRA